MRTWRASAAEPISELLREIVNFKMVDAGVMGVTIPLSSIGSLPAADLQVLFAAAVDSAAKGMRGYKFVFSRTCAEWHESRHEHCMGSCRMNCTGDVSYWSDTQMQDGSLTALLEKTRQSPRLNPNGNISIRITLGTVRN